MKYCHFGVSLVNYSDSGPDGFVWEKEVANMWTTSLYGYMADSWTTRLIRRINERAPNELEGTFKERLVTSTFRANNYHFVSCCSFDVILE